MKTVEDITIYIGEHIDSSPACLETGCMYVCSLENKIHTTTNNIYYNAVLPKGGRFFSIDLDESHVNFAKSYINSKDRIEFFVGDSLDKIKYLTMRSKHLSYGLDLICLDSKEFDEVHMVKEFMLLYPFLNNKHYVLVDDVHNPNSVKYKKLVPILKDLGYDWREVPTPTGMFVASMGYPLWEVE